MRYRRLTVAGDYCFGQGAACFLVDLPEAVAQAVETRLLLWAGEWFLDVTEGTPYEARILGRNTPYDAAIQERIIGTQGVTQLVEYSSSVVDRHLSVSATINTLFGQASVQVVL